MKPRIINGLAEFETLVGQEIGVSDYLTITQEQINKFADFCTVPILRYHPNLSLFVTRRY